MQIDFGEWTQPHKDKVCSLSCDFQICAKHLFVHILTKTGSSIQNKSKAKPKKKEQQQQQQQNK